ncbi:MAG: glycosyltransferase family 39 protein [Acidobacteriota bacterium]
MTRSARWAVVLVLGLLYLPFLGQAFHIDDRIYLEIADNILEKPLHPYDYPAVFEGISAPDAASHSHLPLTSYYLAGVRLLAGDHIEWLDHLAFLVFPLLAAFATYDLARFFVERRLAAALLVVASPAFLVLGHTLMPDVPMLAFWTLAVSRFLRILSGEGGRGDWIALTIAVLAVSFMSLLAAGLLLLIAAGLLLKRLGGETIPRGRWWLVLAAPLILWGLWYLRAYWHYDRFVLINTLLHMDKRDAFDWALFGTKGLSFVLDLGAVFLCPLVLWYGFAGTVRTRVGLLVFLLSFVPFFTFVTGWPWVQTFLFALFFSSGLLVVWEFVLLARETDVATRILALWFFGILAAALLLFYAGSARYALLALPPVTIVWVRRLERRVKDPYFLRNLVWAGVVITGLYALLPAIADHRYADVYRDATRELVQKYQAPGRTVWFTGEWGFRYYASRSGARLLRRVGTDAKTGDIILKPYLASPWVTLYDGDQGCRLLEQRIVHEPFPVRMLDYSSHAGFYSTGWGILPISWSSGENWEWFNVFEVKHPYNGPPPKEESLW